jgi:hypothetical protein
MSTNNGGDTKLKLTATASSITPIDQNLINAILELPEKDFWDLVDTRLNRPKGLRRLRGQLLGQEYVEIIDANNKPSIVERWTHLCLQERLFLELATTKSIVSHNGTCGITVHKYYNQALALRKWILFVRPAPAFVVEISDLSARTFAELKVLNNAQTVLKQAVGLIFENIDACRYHLSIAQFLEVVLK